MAGPKATDVPVQITAGSVTVNTTIGRMREVADRLEAPAGEKTAQPDMLKPGHNVGGIAAEHLRQFIARIEKLEEEKKAIADDIKEVYAEAKGNGFDTKIIRQIIRLRKQEEADRQEAEALLDLYKQALGMI